MNDGQALGIDIGGTGTKFAIVDTNTGELLTERYKEATPRPATPEALLAVTKKWIDIFDWDGSVGIGLPCIVKRGEALSAANIDDTWINFDVASYFSEELNLPVSVLNDADAAGIAEMNFGKGKDKKGSVMLLTIGTGIGSALFQDGILIPNTELGHIKFKGDISERYVSNSTRKAEDLSWKKWGNRFNDFLHHLDRVFSPDMYILGGGISKDFDKYGHFFDCKGTVVPAELQNAAGVVGAAVWAIENNNG